MKAALAAVLAGFQGLGADESRERPVDRLGAMAYAGLESQLASLGVDLIAFKYGHRAASKPRAEAQLAVILGWRSTRLDLSARQCSRVAKHAIVEWMIDMCPTCSGAQEIRDQSGVEGLQRMKPCPECYQTGLRRWSDQERVEALGGDFNKALDRAHFFISKASAYAVSGAARMLERWK